MDDNKTSIVKELIVTSNISNLPHYAQLDNTWYIIAICQCVPLPSKNKDMMHQEKGAKVARKSCKGTKNIAIIYMKLSRILQKNPNKFKKKF